MPTINNTTKLRKYQRDLLNLKKKHAALKRLQEKTAIEILQIEEKIKNLIELIQGIS